MTNLGREICFAKKAWPGAIHALHIEQLRLFVMNYRFSVKKGDLQLIQGHWYVTNAGLLGLANRRHCCGVHTEPISTFCDSTSSRWAFKAIVYKSPICRGFAGYGDADPSNVSALVHGAEMRVAATRAVNRALRKAYGIGICSIEEIGSLPRESESTAAPKRHPPQSTTGNGNGTPRVRLRQIIRQHQLDATLVKSYATDFCGVQSLRDATREQVENFVAHLADWADEDRNALLCPGPLLQGRSLIRTQFNGWGNSHSLTSLEH